MMRDKQRISRGILGTLLALGLILLGAAILAPKFQSGVLLAQNRAPVTVAQKENLGVGVIKETLYALKDDYVDKVNYNDLLKSAAKGVQIYLKQHHLPPNPALTGFPRSKSADANLLEFQDLMTRIMQKYRSKINREQFIYYALKGLMFALKDHGKRDPYSVAMEPSEFRHLMEAMNGGNFGGVGIYIELAQKPKGQLMVVEPIDGTPGARAGLKPGDFITKINGVSTKGIDLDEAAKRIRGPIGSTVRLLIVRHGRAKEYRLVRQEIHVKSATGKMLKDHIGYIRIRFFGEDTGQETESALSALEAKGERALILDVRNNGGGYIKAAKEVCNLFLPAGQLIVSVVNYRKHTDDPSKAYGSTHRHVPMVVLINNWSASASEITAGALHDTHTATLVGVKSFGKGSVQTLHELPDGGALKFTIAHYHTPSGHDINHIGLNPDVYVKMDFRKVGQPHDIQLERAAQYLEHKLAMRRAH